MRHRYRGYIISRGAYQGTTDDRLDRWYIDREEADTWDRRGPGFRSLAEAHEAIDRQERGLER
jgi:hypothetical protein